MLFTAFLLNHKLSINYKQPPSLDFTSYTPFLRGGRVYYVHTPVKTPECKIHATAGHWPISDHFSKMANQISFTLYTWSIKFLKNRKNGQPFQISYFALWSNSNPYLVATHPSHAHTWWLAKLHLLHCFSKGRDTCCWWQGRTCFPMLLRWWPRKCLSRCSGNWILLYRVSRIILHGLSRIRVVLGLVWGILSGVTCHIPMRLPWETSSWLV